MSMVLQDRPYQTEAVGSLWSYFATKFGNPVIAMPTGTGKSIVIARFLQSVFDVYPNQKIMVLTHVKELIQQNYEKLKMIWPYSPAGIFSAGLGVKDHSQQITFAGIQSVCKRWSLFGWVDLLLIDEAHLVSPNDDTMYRSFIAGLKSINPYLKVIGFTATPWRLGHGHITDPHIDREGNKTPSLFTNVCFDITGVEAFNRLISDGYLVPLIPKRTQTLLSVDGVHMRGGEFIESELQTAVDKFEITEPALREAIALGERRKKWLIFASGIDHADHIEAMLNAMGIPCGCVHSKREGRDKTIEDFRAGRIRAVVNNNVLTTGFDDAGIDMIVGLRPTASSVLWVQMLGRGTRPLFAGDHDLNDASGRLQAIADGGKFNCLVLDYASNTKRLGPINDPLVPRRKGQGGGEPPYKCCEACNTWVHISLRFCNGILEDGTICNHEFTFANKLQQGAAIDQLIKGDVPIVEVVAIDHISVTKHTKVGSPDMFRVAYYSGLSRYDEYICVEHTNMARKRAYDWWRLRSGGMNPPPTTEQAMELVGTLRHATHLRVWMNKKFNGHNVPQIMAACFDGTAFGEQDGDSVAPPELEVKLPSAWQKPSGPHAAFDPSDDDIPF